MKALHEDCEKHAEVAKLLVQGIDKNVKDVGVMEVTQITQLSLIKCILIVNMMC